jgi:hypothetical protein
MTRQFLKQFHPMQRAFIRMNMRSTSAPINVPQWFLAAPIEQILRQIAEHFGDKLRAHEVQVDF